MSDTARAWLLPPHYFLMALAAQILLHVTDPGSFCRRSVNLACANPRCA